MIVVLNGTSSSGKSTLAKALQDVLPRPALLLGIDTFVFALPRRFVNDPAHWSEVFPSPYDVLRVGVTCPVEVLDAREAARGDRTVGQARAQHPVVHTFLQYDVVVDTSANTSEECAGTVAAAVSPG